MEGRKAVSWKDNKWSALINSVDVEFEKNIKKAQTKKKLIQFFPDAKSTQISVLYGENGKDIIDSLQKKFNGNPDITILNVNGNSYKSIVHKSKKWALPTYLYYEDEEVLWALQADELVLGEGYNASTHLNDGLRGNFQVSNTRYVPHRDEVVETLEAMINEKP